MTKILVEIGSWVGYMMIINKNKQVQLSEIMMKSKNQMQLHLFYRVLALMQESFQAKLI